MKKRSIVTPLLVGWLMAVCTTCIPMNALRAASGTSDRDNIRLDSRLHHEGDYTWKMSRAGEVKQPAEVISRSGYDDSSWMEAVVPGTVLTSLVAAGVYPDPYYDINNKLSEKKIPDISSVGRDFYTYWFRTEFETPALNKDERLWLKVNGINYRAKIWLNGHLLSTMTGMFLRDDIDITEFVSDQGNALAVLVEPVDEPGQAMKKPWGAPGENRNGGNGLIGLNVTQLMTVGWDFYYDDGIRDRNTGIWRNIELYSTGRVALRHPFVRSRLEHPDYRVAHETVSVEVYNPSASNTPVKCLVEGEIVGTGVTFSKQVTLPRSGHQTVCFAPEEFPQLTLHDVKLWWPKNKGAQDMYELKMSVSVDGTVCDSLTSRFGIREVSVSRETPDSSKLFYVNGKRIFIRGSNWLPEAMQRTTDARMEAELRYTAQSGINLLRLWGGGIAESDRFYQLCDELGILVWQAGWVTGDTRQRHDEPLYFANVTSTIKRIRNHPSLAFYVASNEGSEVAGTQELIRSLDGTLPYQIQSECDGVHDGSPYKQVNPMRHYENTASDRGSRVDGFNPEYGAPNLPIVSTLREMMPEEHLWPINKAVWDYLDGNGFHGMSSIYTDMTHLYGASSSIDEFARKAQLVGAINSKSIWEVWNENKYEYGHKFCSGLLFWYHNVPCPLVCARMWDHSLEPTASLYHTMHALEPLHVQYNYLTDSVTVANDYLQPFANYSVTARVYDLQSRQVSEQTARIDIPDDGCVGNILKVNIPDHISKVHFIHLLLKDGQGSVVSDNFYWRSTDSYEGKHTLTGPCTSGFESLADMPHTHLKASCQVSHTGGKTLLNIRLRNTTRLISFFNQLQLFDADGHSIRPAYYSDNFFTILPGGEKRIVIELADTQSAKGFRLVLSGWNSEERTLYSSGERRAS